MRRTARGVDLTAGASVVTADLVTQAAPSTTPDRQDRFAFGALLKPAGRDNDAEHTAQMGRLGSLAQTEGGEALPRAGILEVTEQAQRSAVERDGGGAPVSQLWYALWTKSHCERLVYDQLLTKGFDAFLPVIDVWSRRAGFRRRIQVPMFPGYLFLHGIMDKSSYVEVRKARGLVGVLGERWDRLAPVADDEVEAIQRVVQARLPVLPYTFLRDGQRVRIISGPLADLEGILVRQKPNTGLLVLSVQLLQRSIAVEVDCTWVAPA